MRRRVRSDCFETHIENLPAAEVDHPLEIHIPVGNDFADTRSFGFHGLFNFPLVLRPDELRGRLEELDPILLAGRDGADLLVELARGDLRQAWRLADRRVAGNGWSSTDLLLRARIATAALRRRFAPSL